MTKKRMAVNAARNISKLIIGFIWHVIIIESYVRLKWLKQHIDARIMGFKSHAEFMQKLLDIQNAKKQLKII